MSATAAPEVVSFLAEHPPFDALAAEDLQRVAGAVEIESHRAGEPIFSQGARAVEHLRVVRRGAVEIVADGRVLERNDAMRAAFGRTRYGDYIDYFVEGLSIIQHADAGKQAR